MNITIIKVLYIDAGADPKGSAILLENGMQYHGLLSTFTVVSSTLTGIDCTEHTSYDIIFIKDCYDDLGAADFVGLLRTIGNLVPVVLLVGIEDDVNDDNIRLFGFSGVLRIPFSTKSLCRVIHKIMQQNAHKLNAMIFYNKQKQTNTMRPIASAVGWDDEQEKGIMLLFEGHLGDAKAILLIKIVVE
eukprot:gene13272-28102_t